MSKRKISAVGAFDHGDHGRIFMDIQPDLFI